MIARGADEQPTAARTHKPWMDLWWLVDGRATPLPGSVARSILTGVPARYVAIPDGQGVAATGRLALGRWFTHHYRARDSM